MIKPNKGSILIGAAMLFLTAITRAQTPEQRLSEMKIIVPSAFPVANNYVHAVRTGNLIYLSGKGPLMKNGKYLVGKLGKTLMTSDGRSAARLIAISQIGVLKDMLGDLSRLKQIIKVNGFVNCTANFVEQSAVIDGFSDLMVAVFGELGKHARTSVGVESLPGNMAVEVEMIIEINP